MSGRGMKKVSGTGASKTLKERQKHQDRRNVRKHGKGWLYVIAWK